MLVSACYVYTRYLPDSLKDASGTLCRPTPWLCQRILVYTLGDILVVRRLLCVKCQFDTTYGEQRRGRSTTFLFNHFLSLSLCIIQSTKLVPYLRQSYGFRTRKGHREFPSRLLHLPTCLTDLRWRHLLGTGSARSIDCSIHFS